MKCEPMKLPGGGFAFLCGGGRRRAPQNCQACLKRRSTKQCDYRVDARSGQTCDRHLCDSCAVRIGEGIDYCPGHPREERHD